MSLLPLGLLSQGGGGAAASGFELIETQLISSTTSSLTFSSIPSSYKHLQIRGIGRSSVAGDTGGFGMQLNADAGSNYTFHAITGDGSSVASLAQTARTNAAVGLMTASGSTTDSFGVLILDILDYTNTNKNKTLRSLTGKQSTGSLLRLASGAWLNTSAVSSITFLDTVGGSFVAGTRFSLYGIGG
jgi:hypothetical protein